MLTQGCRGYILLGTEPNLDALEAKAAIQAMHQADFVVQISAFKSEAVMQYADVVLPMAPFTEAAGTYVNCEGRVQRSSVAATPKGEARPAWKILRVLGNFMEVDGFNYINAEDVVNDIGLGELKPDARLTSWRFNALESQFQDGLERIIDIPMYRGEVTLRHANALQLTADNAPPAVHAHPNTISEINLSDGSIVKAVNGNGSAMLPLRADTRVPPGCVYIPAGYPDSAGIGAGGSIALSAEGADS